MNKINESRLPGEELRLTSPETRRSFPIDKPSYLNPKRVKETQDGLLAKMPREMSEVLLGPGELPENPLLDDNTFLSFARPLEFNFQDAVRFESLRPYKSNYIKSEKKDVRGYYYLKTNKITALKLKDTATINKDELPKIKEALLGVCFNNTGNKISCSTGYNLAFMQNKLGDFFTKHYPAGEKTWNNFFAIHPSNVKKFITATEFEMVVPFQIPEGQKFIDFLRNNIEDEFKFSHWNLKMDFGNFPVAPKLVFVANSTPHVIGDVIYMDRNQSLDEFDTKWTIRHEFGHILGFPDCYHEFYDTSIDSFVNYQLDVTDLMCSRAGNMNERIYKELQRVYLK